MINDHLATLSEELELVKPLNLDEKKKCHFSISEVEIDLQDLDPGIFLQTIIAPNPTHKREEIYQQLMQANLLGQGTGGGVIGMDHEEKNLTLSLAIPHEINYQTLKENIEDFVNYTMHWRETIEKLEKENLL